MLAQVRQGHKAPVFKSQSDEWSTPRSFYQALDAEFGFDFDPCPLDSDFDGLEIEWGQRNFCNPPYSRGKQPKWIQKGFEESRKGKLVVMLLPARTDTAAWHDFVMKADEIRFVRGRLKFGDGEGRATFPSVIVVFRGGA